MAINIPFSSLISQYEEGVDFMINNLGINCKIVYPPIQNECPNCYFTNLPGVGSTSVFKSGGPYPFVDGLCPLCNGVGFQEISTSEIIKVRTYFDKKSWNKILSNVGIKNGDALIIGYMSDIPKFKNMKHIELASDVEGFDVRPYQLSTDLTPWGILKRRYFSCLVSR